ncbi:cell division protein SepF [Enterococcus sp. CSURQ0835]|uniref:cell division protein SepF n=1 Tax=Enterococcus sp. CSURQ0835 TaxID=2681394 RepID=UPI0013583865|nr:cell division protein SepF [Enterococcus sp. CSURQ0835]
MAFSLSKISEFFGLSEEETYEAPVQQPVKAKKETRRPVQSQSTYRPAARPATPQPAKQPAPAKVVAMQKPQATTRPENARPVQPIQKQAVQQTRPLKAKAANTMQTQTAAINQQATRPNRKEAHRKIAIVEPKVYSEAMAIARKIEAGEAVLVNFQSIDEMKARRIVDFLTGVVFMADGDIKRIGSEMFICTPPNVEIDRSTLRNLQEEDIFGLGM